jgi:hypothetical protein
MHLRQIRGRKREFVWPIALALLCLIAIPFPLLGDDKGSSDRSSETPTKIVGPVPLSERERMLLDRLEELEKRVADLESKGNPTTSPVADASAAQPPSANADTSVVRAATPGVSAGATSANSDSLANDRAAAVGPQATEKGKSGAAKPGKAEPFAFADFTWLNGNSRTKDTPYATSFFTPEIRADVEYTHSFNHPQDDTIGGSSEVFPGIGR